jgi:hypothetical protein
MNEHLEVVHFTVKPGEREAFLARRGPAIAALRRRFDGLLESRLAEFDDGTWVDVVRWTSLEQAREAAECVADVEEARAWMAHIDEVRDFRHAALHDSFDADRD